MPKQFYPLFSGKSLFQETVRRNAVLCEGLFLAAGESHLDLVADQIKAFTTRRVEVLAEPLGRSTAPAIALACLALEPEELVLVTPSDHLISQEIAYQKAVAKATELAREGWVVTFGLKPSYPETGFGYIEPEGSRVLGFFEKPDHDTALAYVNRGFLWNSGMFLFKAGVFLEELNRYAPEVALAARTVYRDCSVSDRSWAKVWAPTRTQMETFPSISIDHAVMEKTSRSAVVECDLGWSDLGSFDALYEEFSKDSQGNAVLDGDLPVFLDAQDNLIISTRTIALVGVKDLLVVDTPDALLIVQKGRSQEVKKLVDKLANTEKYESLL